MSLRGLNTDPQNSNLHALYVSLEVGAWKRIEEEDVNVALVRFSFGPFCLKVLVDQESSPNFVWLNDMQKMFMYSFNIYFMQTP